MTREELTNLVIARIAPKGEDAAGVFRAQVYSATDKAAKSLASKIARSDQWNELVQSYQVALVEGKGTLPAGVLPAFIRSVYLEGATGGEELSLTPTYTSIGGASVGNEELWGDGRLEFTGFGGFTNDALVSPSSPDYPLTPTYGLKGNNAGSDVVFELGIAYPAYSPALAWAGATSFGIKVRSNPADPNTKQVVWQRNGVDVAASVTVPQFPLRPQFVTSSHGNVKLIIPTTAVQGGHVAPAPTFGEMMALTKVNQHFYVVEGSTIHVRAVGDSTPVGMVKVKASYVPTIDTFPSQFDEALIEEVILILGKGGNTNG